MEKSSHLERLKAKLAGASPSQDGAPAAHVPAPVAAVKVAIGPEHTDFASFPEYREISNTRWYYKNEKFEWNLFRAHSGVSGATVMIDGRLMVNFSSYNYLGLAGDARMKEASKRAIDEHGTSNGAGRMITGEIGLHAEFEREIAAVHGTEDAVLSLGGYSTNALAIGFLARRQDLIVYDELVHNSALIGSKLSGARRFSFPHNDYDALDRLLQEHRSQYERALVLTEGVYSMDGDIPDVPRMIEIKRRHKAFLMVDEAHSMGVIGPRGLGVVDHFGLDGADIDIHYASMSKAFATVGGYVAGKKELVTMLKHSAPGVQVYAAAPTAASTAAGLQALRLMQAEPQRAQRLRDNADHFRKLALAAGLDIGLSAGSAVVPIMVGDSETALWLSVRLFEANVCAFPMIFPIVPRGAARLRFFLNTEHTQQQIEDAVALLVQLRAKAPKSKGLF